MQETKKNRRILTKKKGPALSAKVVMKIRSIQKTKTRLLKVMKTKTNRTTEMMSVRIRKRQSERQLGKREVGPLLVTGLHHAMSSANWSLSTGAASTQL